ncbi:muskelin-like isoform X2 [Dysidea avara]|uniref:muskelin-like isoform X2 n=1 Tax=Dysidea avara TaxID=196820 RepID=UPI00332AC677
MASIVTEDVSRLSYTIYKWSSFSGDYLPSNILEDKPHDQKSRWSSETNDPPQFLFLKLARTAVVHRVTFGKYENRHVCNVKKLEVHGGLEEDHMTMLWEGGLQNNSQSETFTLKHSLDDHVFPCNFIKIVPLQSWGQSFNFSIWYVELWGLCSPHVITPALNWVKQYRNQQAVRLCLKHLRQCDFTEAYEALQKKARVLLEHPRLTELHKLLVDEGDYASAEHLLEQSSEEKLLDGYVAKQAVKPQWTLLNSKTSEVCGEWPYMRGGHQLCIDCDSEVLYLFGGWDGTKSLSDLWRYDITSAQWMQISADTSQEGGPNPCSCHKMCFDSVNKKLYVLGHYAEEQQSNIDLVSPLYCYCARESVWTLLSSDTNADGGPQLLYDHQMCFDSVTQSLYVFGGRILMSSNFFVKEMLDEYSGLYAYHCPSNKWSLLRSSNGSIDGSTDLRSRMAHSMVFHPVTRKLYFLGGQRGRDLLSDLVSYDVESDEAEVLCDGVTNQIPAVGYTLRASLDPIRNQIYLLTGLNKHNQDKKIGLHVSLWVYDITTAKWTCIVHTSQHSNILSWQQQDVPCPRFAHQFVYDHVHQVHYLFGGNPSKDHSHMRLDDLWKLKLFHQSREALLLRCQYLIRKCKFQELALSDPVEAIRFLRTELSSLVNHDDAEESKEFRELTLSLISSSPSTSSSSDMSAIRVHRSQVYNQLSLFFPEHMAQPSESLTDLLNI